MLRLTPTNDADREKLAALQIERFRTSFGCLLLKSNIWLSGLDGTLVIGGGKEMALLPLIKQELIANAWAMCAASQIKIYSCNKLILDLPTHRPCNKLGIENRTKATMVATAIENLALETGLAESAPASKVIRSMALADIAGDLEAPVEDLKAFLQEQNATLIDFQGTILVPENEAIAAYEHYSVIRARQKMQERFSQEREAKPKKGKVESDSDSDNNNNKRQKRTYLTWKGAFKVNKTSYKKTIQSAVSALFPKSESEQRAALIDISNRSDLGKAIVDKITRDSAYTDKANACENLFKAAEQLIASTETETESEE